MASPDLGAAAVDSLDRKITKDLSTLDKNTIYLMRMSFGPSEIPEWKREQFPNVKYDEYIYLKSAMSNTEQMGYQIFTNRESVKYESNTVTSVNIVPVSHEFIDIQGLEFDEVIVPFVTDKDYRTEIDRSMLYVACTRAMHKLYISASGNISTFLS